MLSRKEWKKLGVLARKSKDSEIKGFISGIIFPLACHHLLVVLQTSINGVWKRIGVLKFMLVAINIANV